MKGGPTPSLQTVIDLIAADASLPAWRRAGLKCGVAQIARGLRRRAEDLPADWGLLRASIEEINVADMGWSRRTAANHRTNCRKAIEVAIPTRASGVGRLALTDDWRVLWDQVLDENHRRRLSVGVRFFSAMGLSPNAIDEPALDLLMAHRKSSTPHGYALSDRRRFAQAWNSCAELIAGWPVQKLQIPPDGRFRGVLFRDFPLTLQREIDNYFASRSVSRSLSTLNVRTYGARTASTRRRELVAFAARAAEFRTVSELGSLKVLLDPDLVVEVLEAYWSDNGEEPSTYTIDLAWRLYLIARESACLDGDKLQQLAEIKSKLQKRRRHGITEKNRKLIRAIRSTDIWSKVCKLPYDLMAEARREHNKNPKKAQTAVAIAILTYAPVRVGNLASTRIGEHLNRVGGPKGVLFLVYSAQEVKNHVDLEFELGANLDGLISEYIDRHRSILVKTNTNALFPSRHRSAIAPPLLSERIKQMVKRRTGLDITAHEFRHAAAAMLLKAQPGNYALVAKVLGHKAVRTAIAYYIGLETLDANRIFASIINDDLLAKRRG